MRKSSFFFAALFMMACGDTAIDESPESATPLADQYNVAHLIQPDQDAVFAEGGFAECLDFEGSGDLENELRAVEGAPGEFQLYGTISPNFDGTTYDDPEPFVAAVFGEVPTTLIVHCVFGSADDTFNNALIRYLRANDVATKMLDNSRAFSGGVDLFTAGVTRTMSDGARLGVHSWGATVFVDQNGMEVQEDELIQVCEDNGITGEDACLAALPEFGFSQTIKGGNQFTPLDDSNPSHASYVQLARDMGVSTDYYWLTLEVDFEGSLWLDSAVSKQLKLATE